MDFNGGAQADEGLTVAVAPFLPAERRKPALRAGFRLISLGGIKSELEQPGESG
jgi:hypothetical protein